MSMKAAVVLDTWKLPVFRRRLDAAGFKYSEAHPWINDTTCIQVEYSDVSVLKHVLECAAEECELMRKTPTEVLNG